MTRKDLVKSHNAFLLSIDYWFVLIYINSNSFRLWLLWECADSASRVWFQTVSSLISSNPIPFLSWWHNQTRMSQLSIQRGKWTNQYLVIDHHFEFRFWLRIFFLFVCSKEVEVFDASDLCFRKLPFLNIASTIFHWSQ